ncbi:VanZ family protein [Cytobacillus sp. FJAT-53684]|uniref:VanZ family protein n=1 Tax=Cytobacillus mangrovibacter TaxID=3299024 RepID=A0ABW6JWN2_9BACI
MKKILSISLLLSLSLFLLLYPIFIQLIAFLHPIVLGVVFFCIIIVVLFILLFMKKKTIHLSYSLFSWILIFYTITLLILLFLRPNHQIYDSINLVPFATIKYYLSGKVNLLVSFYNLAANIGLFIPYGIFLMTRNYSSFILIFTPLLFISFIELGQFITHRGSLDIDDLILNLLGISVGYLIYPMFKRVVKIKKSDA